MADRPQPFLIKDCALLSIATGRRAQNLRELRDHLSDVDASCIYYHFWGRLLRPRFDDPEYNNDLAAWVGHALGELRLAEQLAVIDPAAFALLEDLRREVLEAIEAHLDQTDYLVWARRQEQFNFRRAQTVVFSSGRSASTPAELAKAIDGLSLGSIFYHFVDARRRPPQLIDDFRAWLGGFGEQCSGVIRRIEAIDPYFTDLAELRSSLAGAFRELGPV